MRLLLASQSPRRQELLAKLGYPIEIVKNKVDEHVSPDVPADRVAEHLARRKALAGYPVSHLADDEVLVTADTVVVLDGRVLGKPASHEEASAMLHSLSGRSHEVYTGVGLTTRHESCHSFTEKTTVHFRPLEDKEIEYYIDHYHPYDKAGAYGIQEWIGMVGVSRIEGCYYNVMGLPVARLYEELKHLMSKS